MLTRLRWSAFGLRGRIVGMVLVTTVATLVIAAVGLLPRLQSSLRKASVTSVHTDVKANGRQLRAVARIPYRYGLISGDAWLLRDDPVIRKQLTGDSGLAGRAVNSLNTDLHTLLNAFGASQVILFGYIDQSGQGRPVSPTNSASNAEQQFVDRATSAVASAFHSDKKSYIIQTVNGKQYVRATIPLPRSDSVLVVYKSIDAIPDEVSAVAHSFELAAAAGLLLTLLLAIPLAATLVRRLQQLRQAALRVAIAGAGAEFPVDRARDEVGDLARSFAIMQRRLRHQEEARRAFVATASHELRTPLASLDGMLELLADDLNEEDLDLDDANALLERARVQSRRLGRLAADLLDLSRIDADVALRSEPVELGELSRAVLAEFELAMKERGVTEILHDDCGPVWALGDPGSVARILRILLDNALRIAPRGSEISVELSCDPVPTLSVVDQGPGIASEERALIFERFKRGRDTGGEAGFGLGLAIGRELAERMGGTLVLANSGPGAKFTLTLPLAQAPAADRVTSAAGV